MPKIIEDIRGRVLRAARAQVLSYGYAATTIRSIAAACEIGVGTVYNYFSSKDMIIATYMLEDWNAVLSEMETAVRSSMTPAEVLLCVYDRLLHFQKANATLFADPAAAEGFYAALKNRHPLLRSQLSEILRPICQGNSTAEPDFVAQFIAEAMLTWMMEGTEFEKLCPVLLSVIQ